MPTLSLTDPVAHTTADAGIIATNNGNLRTLLNGGVDDVNLAGITGSKITGLVVYLGTNVVSGAGTDLTWGGGNSVHALLNISTGGGTLRTLAAPTKGAGCRTSIRNGSAASVTITHNAGAGTGAKFNNRGDADVVLAVDDSIEYIYDGTVWVELSRNTSAVTPIGAEIVYTEFTAPVTAVATTEATANTVVTASAFTADGTSAYLLNFFSPAIRSFGGNRTTVALYLDGSSIGIWDYQSGSATTVTDIYVGVSLVRRTIPASGSRTYSARIFCTNASQGDVQAGVGGSGALMPGFIRITKAT